MAAVSVDQQLDKLISHLGSSITEIRWEQRVIFENLVSPKNSSIELPIKTSETENSAGHPEWLIPDVEKKLNRSLVKRENLAC